MMMTVCVSSSCRKRTIDDCFHRCFAKAFLMMRSQPRIPPGLFVHVILYRYGPYPPARRPGLKALMASQLYRLQGDRFRLHDCHPGFIALMQNLRLSYAKERVLCRSVRLKGFSGVCHSGGEADRIHYGSLLPPNL